MKRQQTPTEIECLRGLQRQNILSEEGEKHLIDLEAQQEEKRHEK